MRRAAAVYQNDIGARIVLRVKKSDGTAYDSVATASVKQIKLTLPSGTVKTFSAAWATSPYGVGDGTDGVMEYVTADVSDLAEAGVYEVRGYLELSATEKRHTQPVTMYVGAIPGAAS